MGARSRRQCRMDGRSPADIAGARRPGGGCLRDRARRSGSRNPQRGAHSARPNFVCPQPAASHGDAAGSPDRLPDEWSRSFAGSRISGARNRAWPLWDGFSQVADAHPGRTRAVSRLLADIGLRLLGFDGWKARAARVGRNEDQVGNRAAKRLRNAGPEPDLHGFRRCVVRRDGRDRDCIQHRWRPDLGPRSVPGPCATACLATLEVRLAYTEKSGEAHVAGPRQGRERFDATWRARPELRGLRYQALSPN